MISMKSFTWMDVDAVLSAVRDAGMKPLMKAGLLVERAAKVSMRAGGRKTGPRGGKVHEPSDAPAPPHVQSGTLRGSISTSETSAFTVVVGPTSPPAWYGVVHEFGGKKYPAEGHPPRPFMRPALDRTKSVFSKFWRNLPIAKFFRGSKRDPKTGRFI